jgi:outer membrane protein
MNVLEILKRLTVVALMFTLIAVTGNIIEADIVSASEDTPSAKSAESTEAADTIETSEDSEEAEEQKAGGKSEADSSDAVVTEDDDDSAESEEPSIKEVLELTLEESIEMALANSPDIKVAEIEHEKAKEQLRRAKKDAKNVKDARKVPSSYINNLPPDEQLLYRSLYSYDAYLLERVLPLSMEMAEILSEKGVQFQKDLLKFQVENAYYEVLKAEKEVENAEDSLARAKEQLRLALVGLDVGVNAQVDVLGAELLVAQAQLGLTNAKNNLKIKRMEFNNLLSLPLDTEVKLISNFAFEKVEFDLEEIGKKAREKNLDYIQLHESFKVQKEAFALASSYYTPNVYIYQEAEQDFEIARLKLQNADEELDLKIQKAYFAALNAEELYNLMQKAVEQAEENYRLTKLRYEVGMTTLLDLEKAAGELDSAKTELLTALYNYNIATTMLEHAIFLAGMGGEGNGGF